MATIESAGTSNGLDKKNNRMTHTWHIHLSGLVQGVGFRPYTLNLAAKYALTGTVANGSDGVHIYFNARAHLARKFYRDLIQHAPEESIINHQQILPVAEQHFHDFSIVTYNGDQSHNSMLLTPDRAPCPACLEAINNPADRRYRYAFTTCVHCGPRYSIMKSMPFEREHTSMAPFAMCPDCLREYTRPVDSRFHSQTNSCPHCAITLHLYHSSKECVTSNSEEVLGLTKSHLQKGHIVALKGTGGYLLLCDATNETAIQSLRLRKQRPAKPLALLYPSLKAITNDTLLNEWEQAALTSAAAPIVLCTPKNDPPSGIHRALIAPQLHRIGIMLPANPLLHLVASDFGKPLVATSANISGAPLVYRDKDALLQLFEIADCIVTHDREILAPQDDSVLQFTCAGRKIILRRSRGLAPNYYPHTLDKNQPATLAMGADLKSGFSILAQDRLYCSQYLGKQGSIEARQAFTDSLQQVLGLSGINPQAILTDTHPGYITSEYGRSYAADNKLPLFAFQHHRAHIGAVLAENGLLNSKESVLGFAWDGTGYGDDGQTWGSEVIRFENGQMERFAQLKTFRQMLGDKMSREPRLSALSLLECFPHEQLRLKKLFSQKEWDWYQQLNTQAPSGWCSSMGRWIDGLAALLGVCSVNSYEGQAAMQLEALADQQHLPLKDCYPVSLNKTVIEWSALISALLADADAGLALERMASKLMNSLVQIIKLCAATSGCRKLVFSGGVFQNRLLVETIEQELQGRYQLYFHRKLSPNDECIAMGQLACYQLQQPVTSAEQADKLVLTNR